MPWRHQRTTHRSLNLVRCNEDANKLAGYRSVALPAIGAIATKALQRTALPNMPRLPSRRVRRIVAIDEEGTRIGPTRRAEVAPGPTPGQARSRRSGLSLSFRPLTSVWLPWHQQPHRRQTRQGGRLTAMLSHEACCRRRPLPTKVLAPGVESAIGWPFLGLLNVGTGAEHIAAEVRPSATNGPFVGAMRHPSVMRARCRTTWTS